MKLELKSRLLGLLQIHFFVAVALGVIPPAFAAPDNQGKAFVLGFMENYDGGGSVSFYLTAAKATTVTVQGAGFGPADFSVGPGTVTPVSLPVTVRATGSGKIEDKGLLLSAPDEFIVYGLNQKVFTTDAYLGLPTDSLGTEYIVPSMPNAKKTLPSELLIIASEDGTEVTITPKKKTLEGADVKSIKAGKSARFTLNRLQSIQFKAKGGTAADLTGSVVTSSKPVSVFGGHQCGVVPARALACDHLVEQIPPIDTWGTSFLTTPLATRTGGDIFRILASKNGTKVDIDGKTVAKLKRGQFKQVGLASGSFHQITTSGPALVVQYSKGTSVDRVVSDPFMMIIPPTEQFGADYLISTPPEEPVRFENYINIVAPTDKLGSLRLDGNAISGPFTAIGATGFSGAQVKVDIGVHQISHDPQNVPFGVYSYGFAASDSYGYPGGARLAKIADECSPTETVPADGIDNDCDRRIDEELFNGIDDDGDGKIDEDLARIRPPVANAGGTYTVNEGGSVVLNGANSEQDPYGDTLVFEWDLDNDGSFETSGAMPSFQGIDGPSVQTVILRVTGQGGVNQVSTTITVDNVAPAVDAGADAAIDEGAAFSQAGTFIDPGTDSWTATVDYGDGTSAELALNGKTFGLEHTYRANGVYTVTVTVTDDDGDSGSDTVQVTVNNVAPVVDAGADAAIDEGVAFSQTGSFADPGPGPWSATVDYGDGTSGELALNGKTFSLEHLYRDNGNYTVTVTVTDEKGAAGSDTVQVTVNNVAPMVDAGADAAIDEGVAFSQTGSFADPGPGPWSATVDYGDGTSGELALNGKTFSLEHLYRDNGAYTVTVTVTDEKGAAGSDTVQVTVNNVAPVVDAGADAAIDEGAAFSQTGSFADPGPGPWSATVDYGDGTSGELALNGKTFSLEHLYRDNGNYTVTVTVTDEKGAVGSDTVQVTVNNVAPVVDAGVDAVIDEGAAFSQTGSFVDPGPGPWSATIDYGDGTSGELALTGKNFSLNHVYGDNGVYTVAVTVTDEMGATGSDTVQVTVNNVAPAVDAGADAVIDEGAAFSQTGSFVDPGPGPWSATVDYGDGTSGELALTGKNFSLNHVYGDNGVYTVTVTVTDEKRAVGSDTVQVTVNNVAPVVDAGADAAIDEGTAFISQTGSFIDSGPGPWSATVDYGDGTSGELALNGKTFSLEHLYRDNGSYTVTVTVTDEKGAAGSDTVQVTVNNVAPVVDAGADAAIDEGKAFISQTGSFIDSGPGPWSATVDYGDGTSGELALTGKNFSLNHVYGDNGVYTVTVTVTDEKGAVGSDTVQVTVNNVAPVVDAGADTTIGEGAAFSQTGSFVDPGPGPWSATIDYGDGTSGELALNGKNFSLNHVYGDNGVYTVAVTVTDEMGATGSDTVQVTVNNVAPVVDAGADAAIDEGTAFISQTGSFIDSGPGPWSATVNYGDGTGVQPLTLAGKNFSLNHVYGNNGAYTVTVTVTDEMGATGNDTVRVIVNNVAPEVYAGADAAIDEGAAFSQTGSFADSGTGPWSAIVNYGDGTGIHSLTLAGKNFSLNHVYGDNGVYTVTVTVTDEKGAVGSDTAWVTVNNVAPTITDASWNDSCEGDVVVTYSDPANALDESYVLTINWSIYICPDGNCSMENYQQVVSDYSSGDPVFLDYNPGTSVFIEYSRPTSLTVTDKDGGSGTTTATLPNLCAG